MMMWMSIWCSSASGQTTYTFSYTLYFSPTSPGTCTGAPQVGQASAVDGQCIVGKQLFGGGSNSVKIVVNGDTAVLNVYSTLDCTGSFSATPSLTNGQCRQDGNKDLALSWTVTSTTPGTTVWGGVYQVNSGQCNTATCCCVDGTFAAVQTGTQVNAILGLTGSCNGALSTPVVLTLPSGMATSASATVLGQTLEIVKNGNTVTLTNQNAPQCSGSATCTSGDCRASSSSNVCFHHSTVIEYPGGEQYTLRELQVHAVLKGYADRQCHVPHVVQSRDGVIIETVEEKQGGERQRHRVLHLTGDHLVHVAVAVPAASAEEALQGSNVSLLKAARQVAVGDVLFANLQQTRRVTVTKVTLSTEEDTYFGLNCLRSDVLANGIKTSTFGHHHAVPAAWMNIVGRVFGIERASQWGNSIAEWWHSF